MQRFFWDHICSLVRLFSLLRLYFNRNSETFWYKNWHPQKIEKSWDLVFSVLVGLGGWLRMVNIGLVVEDGWGSLRLVEVGWVVEVCWGWVGGGPPLSLPSSASHHQSSLGSWVARDWQDCHRLDVKTYPLDYFCPECTNCNLFHIFHLLSECSGKHLYK